VQDQALQTAPGGALELEDEGGNPRFPGVSANGYAPPDPNLAVGPNHIVQMVNVQIAVYSKSGTIFAGYPKPIGSIFSALGGGCTGNFGDPIVQYDKAADRWLISQLGSFSAPFSECIAVSRTNDPTGAYNLYAYSFGTNLNDYPKFGVWPTSTNSAYVATYNLFAGGGPFVGAALCAYDRAAMLSGAASPASICYTITNDGSFLPRRRGWLDVAARWLARCLPDLRDPEQPEILPTVAELRQPGQFHLERADGHRRGLFQRGLRRRNLHPAIRNLPATRFLRRPPDVPPGLPQFRRSRSPGGESLSGRRFERGRALV